MRFFRHLVATLCLGGLGLSAAPAYALGTLTFSPPTWTKRVDDRTINVLNRKDCLDGATASFSYSIQGVTGGVFEVWSGAGCDNKDNRSTSATTKTCARVAVGSTVETRIDLNFQEMVKAYGLTEDAGVAACDTPQGAGTQNRALYFVVYDLNSFASLVTSTPATWAFSYDIVAPPAPTNVRAIAGDMTLSTTFTPPPNETNLLNYRFYCSLKGNAPVTGTAGSGGTAGASTAGGGTGGTDGGGTASSDIAGTDAGGNAGTDPGAAIAGTDAGGNAGTDPGAAIAGTDAGGTAGTDPGAAIAGTDAGGTAGTATSAAAGTDAGGTGGSSGAAAVPIDPSCTSSVLIPGEPPPTSGFIDCGTIGALTSTGGETDPKLSNETEYVVAVATEDNANNVGVLSNLACGIPRDVKGFYEAYREAGGQAGGGYCTFAPAQRDALWMGAALLLTAGAFWRRRK